MNAPKFRQNENAGINGTSITGKIVKVVRTNNGYQYRLAVKAVNGAIVHFTQKESSLHFEN